MIYRLLLILAFLLFIEFYAFQAIRTLFKARWILLSYQGISLMVLFFIIYSVFKFDQKIGQTQQSMFAMGVFLLAFVPKILLMLFMFGEDVFRLAVGGINYFLEAKSDSSVFPERRKFISQIGLGLAAVPFLSLIYGISFGRYNYKVIKQAIYFHDLPEAFEDFTITQISDLHSGSFDNPEKIAYAVDLINQQNSDLILFTGDIVNTHATEMHPWISVFNTIKPHAFGKFAVLGNHDYGEYVLWTSQKQKDDNFIAIKDLYSQIGFKLLLNEHVYIEKDQDKLALVGVENWGHNFKQAGDLNKASKDLSAEEFKILMSHDPSHWEYEVKKHDKNFQLTLSGHTHGMQFGIEIPGIIKWSLAQYVYKQWAGLYENLGRYVYVNRGFGFHAYPGRVGIMPEITVIKLKKGNKVA